MNLYITAMIVLSVVALWKLFEKSGEQGWKAIIPFYNTYIKCKLADCVNLFIAYLVLSIGAYVLIIAAYLQGLVMAFKGTRVIDKYGDTDQIWRELTSELGFNTVTIVIAVIIIIAALFAATVITAIININFIKCYCQDTSIKVMAGVGAIKGLSFLNLIAMCIAAFGDNYVYHDPRINREWSKTNNTNTYEAYNTGDGYATRPVQDDNTVYRESGLDGYVYAAKKKEEKDKPKQ